MTPTLKNSPIAMEIENFRNHYVSNPYGKHQSLLDSQISLDFAKTFFEFLENDSRKFRKINECKTVEIRRR